MTIWIFSQRNALVKELGNNPPPAEMTQRVEASELIFVRGKRANGDAADCKVGGGWQSWSKGEKIGVGAAAVLVAMVIIVVSAAVISVNRKRRIRKKKQKEKAEKIEEEIRKEGKIKTHTEATQGIEMMESVRNSLTAVKLNHENSRVGTRQGTSGRAAEPLMMSGAL